MNTLGNQIIRLSSVDSTNNYAANMIRQNNVGEGTVILALNQLNGRGQVHNNWETEGGKNLTVSIVLKPTFLEASEQFVLSQMIAVSLVEVLVKLGLSDVAVKWPNDILLNNKKVAGVLVENSVVGKNIAFSIVGVGLNVNQENFEKLPHATSLKCGSGNEYEVDRVLELLLNQMNKNYLFVQQRRNDILKKNYFSYLIGVDEFLRYTVQGVTDKWLRIVDVDSLGRVVVEDDKKEMSSFNFQELKLDYSQL